MRGPDLSCGRIEGDSFGVGHIVAELRGFTAVNDGGSHVESADSEFGATELLDGGTILGAALLGSLLRVASLKIAI